MELGPIELLIIQGSPLCNIDCKYCYLPNRTSSRTIPQATLAAAFEKTLGSRFVEDKLTILWHAGEPLVLPIEFYQRAIALSETHNSRGLDVEHCIQTNATLINQAWCDLFIQHRIKIGVSIDGPADIHDAQRVTRRGLPTHARAMQGVGLLQDNGIPFYTICVLTDQSLDCPDEIYHFFRENGFTYVGFNAEEVEGINESSSLETAEVVERFRVFMSRILELCAEHPDGPVIREFELLHRQLFRSDSFHVSHGQQLTPYRIVSVDVDGSFYTWCPEFLDMTAEDYSDFALGNFLTGDLEDAVHGPVFRRMYEDIASGISQCEESCPYFSTCGGGAPVNKFCENGTFQSTETMYCRLRNQVLVDTYLDHIEMFAGAESVS